MGSAPRSGRRLDTRTEPPEKGPRAAQGQPLPQAKGEGLAHRGGRLGPRRVRIGHSREQGLGKWPGDRGSGQRSRGGQLLGAPRPGLRCSPGTGQLRPGSDLQSAATPCLPSACPLGGAGTRLTRGSRHSALLIAPQAGGPRPPMRTTPTPPRPRPCTHAPPPRRRASPGAASQLSPPLGLCAGLPAEDTFLAAQKPRVPSSPKGAPPSRSPRL